MKRFPLSLTLTLALAFVLLRALPNLSYPIGRDQSTYAVIAQGLLHGKQLYRDLWDMKPPGIFYLYIPFVGLLGNVSWLVGLIDIVWLLAVSYALYRFAEPFVGEAAAVLAVVVYACWHCRAGYVNAGQPEDFLTLFVLLAYLAVPREERLAKSRLLVAGLLFGAAFWVKYNAIVFLPLLIVIPYVDWKLLDSAPPRFGLRVPVRKWLRSVAILLVGFALAVGLVLALFGLAGLWTILWQSHLEMLLKYGVSPIRRVHGYWLILIIRTLYVLGPSLLASVIALKVASAKKELSRAAPICLAAAVGYGTAAAQVRLAPYAFETCYPFFAIVWGYLGMCAYESIRRLWGNYRAQGRRTALILTKAGVAVTLGVLVLYEAQNIAGRYRDLDAWRRNPDQFFIHYSGQFPIEHLASQVHMIHLLKQHSSAGDDLFVWGAYPLLYYRTGLTPATRFIVNFPFIAPWGPAIWRKQLLTTLQKSPPSFIVVGKHDQLPSVTFTQMDSQQYLKEFPQLSNFIHGRYKLVATLTDFVLYQREQPNDLRAKRVRQ